MPDTKGLARKTTHESRWTRLHEDTVQFPHGTDGIYWIVDKDDFTLIFPRHADGHIQLIQQFSHPVSGRFWKLPQGSWEAKPGSHPRKLQWVSWKRRRAFG